MQKIPPRYQVNDSKAVCFICFCVILFCAKYALKLFLWIADLDAEVVILLSSAYKRTPESKSAAKNHTLNLKFVRISTLKIPPHYRVNDSEAVCFICFCVILFCAKYALKLFLWIANLDAEVVILLSSAYKRTPESKSAAKNHTLNLKFVRISTLKIPPATKLTIAKRYVLFVFV